MRFTLLAAIIAIALIVDQVRTGGYYRREIAYTIEQSLPAFARPDSGAQSKRRSL